MFPFRTSSIFRSRWIALCWAAGVVWTAISFVPDSQDNADTDNADRAVTTDVTGAPVTDAQLRETQRLLENMGH